MMEADSNDPVARKKRDNARLKSIALKHGAVLLAALTLWGTADHWAFPKGILLAQGIAPEGMLLAQGIALVNALFAGLVISYLMHEWGHFTGARVTGAVSPVLKEPKSFFMFTFKDEYNTREQFLAMSIGGPLANWTLFVLLFILLPLETVSQALLLATTLAIAVSVSVFELPIIYKVTQGGDPQETLQKRLAEAGAIPRAAGITVGAMAWLLVAF